MLLDESYFIGKYSVPQLEHAYVLEKFNTFIDEWEPKILNAAMGYDLSTAFLTGINVGSGDTIDQRWKDLLDGIAFVNSYGRKELFCGFANDVKKVSAMTGMIFSKYLEDNTQQVTASGPKKGQSENADNTNEDLKIRNAWNDTTASIRILWDFLSKNKATYPEYTFSQIDHCFFGNKNLFGI